MSRNASNCENYYFYKISLPCCENYEIIHGGAERPRGELQILRKHRKVLFLQNFTTLLQKLRNYSYRRRAPPTRITNSAKTAKITIFTKLRYPVAKTAKLFIEAQSAPNENYKYYYFYKISLYPVAKTAKLFIEAQSTPNQNYKFCETYYFYKISLPCC